MVNCQITGHKVTIVIDPEAVAVATRDDYGISLANARDLPITEKWIARIDDAGLLQEVKWQQ